MSDECAFLFLAICLLPLAVRYILAVWFQKDGLFEEFRMKLEARGDSVSKAVQCPLCFSFHITATLLGMVVIMTFLCQLYFNGLAGSLYAWVCLPIYIPAGAGAGQILFERWEPHD